MIVELQNKTCDINKLYNYLLVVDSDFKVPLSNKVNLLEYSSKILHDGHVVVEMESDKILSCICFYCNDHNNQTACVTLMSTCIKAQGKGYAKALNYKVFDICKKHGMSRVVTESVNPMAVKVYLSTGYNIINTKKNDGIVCSVLEKKL